MSPSRYNIFIFQSYLFQAHQSPFGFVYTRETLQHFRIYETDLNMNTDFKTTGEKGYVYHPYRISDDVSTSSTSTKTLPITTRPVPYARNVAGSEKNQLTKHPDLHSP